MKKESRAMSNASSLSRNLLYNLSGPLLPILTAAICIPVLIRQIGTDRFGLLTIAWGLIGYFSLFDFGLGRSLTWQVSRYLGDDRQSDVSRLVRNALVLMACLSLIGSLIVAVFATGLIGWLKVPPQLLGETRNAFLLLGASIPLVVLTSGLRGVLEAFQRFDITNAIRMLQGFWTFTGPLCVLPFTVRLDAIVIVLVAGRLVTTIAYFVAVRSTLPVPRHESPSGAFRWRELLAYGGWTTLSSTLSPLMDYMDRFFISAFLGTAIVAFYTTPYELVYRLVIIPDGVLGVLFPLMAKRFTRSSGRVAGQEMLSLGAKLITVSVFPIILILVLATPSVLRWWVGTAFEQNSSLVMQLLAVGLLINSFARVPSSLIQASGRSDITAKFHLLELPLYVAGLLWMLDRAGIAGAALVWALRMLVDCSALLWVSHAVTGVPSATIRRVAILASVQVGAAAGAIFVGGFAWKVAYGAGALLVFGSVFYRHILLESERQMLRESARRLKARLSSGGALS